ncbi:11615_t:CDS:2, partial [Diversispora eburnea]
GETSTNNCQLWWETLSNLCNKYNYVRAYSPGLHTSNSNNFSNLSSIQLIIFLRSTLSYGWCSSPHAFTINGRAYHQVYPANTRGHPVNWFVFDANVRNCLYQLYNMNYPQAQLVIQQSTNIAENVACTINHSKAIAQERCVQIWRVGEEKPDYVNILNKNYEALQYPLFFPHGEIGVFSINILVDMFIRADERLQYVPSHTLSYRWSYKKAMDALAVIKAIYRSTLNGTCFGRGDLWITENFGSKGLKK